MSDECVFKWRFWDIFNAKKQNNNLTTSLDTSMSRKWRLEKTGSKLARPIEGKIRGRTAAKTSLLARVGVMGGVEV